MKENIIAGLISGVTVTIFVVFFTYIWKAIIVPWFEDRVYKDVRIEGMWYSVYPEDFSLRQEVINLKRHGHHMEGTITCLSETDKGKEYKVFGSFRNLILPLIYESSEASKTDRGTITLKLVNNGERLVGEVAAYSTSKDQIVTASVVWYRNKQQQQNEYKNLNNNG